MRTAPRVVVRQCSEEECVTSEMEIHEHGAMSEASAPQRIPRRVSSLGPKFTLQWLVCVLMYSGVCTAVCLFGTEIVFNYSRFTV